jgi:peroxiredoxin Q/BCP
MSQVEIGKLVPNFKLAATGDQQVELKSLRGKNVVLYFYPKDNTPGCTTESCEFGAKHREFSKLNTVILGVSRDSLSSHEKFKAKFEFPFDLLVDDQEELCQMFDVIKEKNMYGKKVMGIERSTFLIDDKGKLQREWRKVKVDGHVAEVLDAVRELAA